MNKPAKKPAAGEAAPADAPHIDGWRETIESVVIALILAFLFKAFEAEAFVIPTGSMGPTLMGLHKDVDCPQCGFRYQAGVSFEADDIAGVRKRFKGGPLDGQLILAQTCTCPNCRYTASVNPDREGSLKLPDHTLSYAGDRIWVSKASYEVSEPKRWDVAVFKYPLGADQNYIKRLVGMPDEAVRIFRGDLFTMPRPDESSADSAETNLSMSEFTIARKPAHKVLATLQPVYDNDYLLPELTKLGWPLRWQGLDAEASQADHHWQPQDEGRAYAIDGQLDGAWLAYRHIVPGWNDWQRFAAGQRLPAGSQPRPQLITDFCAYDTATEQYSAPEPEPRSLGIHWVSDLAVECEAEIRGNQGRLTLAIVEAGRLLRCQIDVATGLATLSIDGMTGFAPKGTTGIKGPGKYELRFANVDDQLLLWVDDEPIAFDGKTEYSLDPPATSQAAPGGVLPNQLLPTEADLAPVRIASSRLPVTLRHLRVRRDIYYIAVHRPEGQISYYLCDYVNDPFSIRSAREITEFFTEPGRWAAMGSLAIRDFPLEADQYLMLGDNSPSSSDSRFWEDDSNRERYYVSRELLIGKAFFVYWPHAWETYPHFTISLRTRDIGVPFYPNFWDMRAIR
ncbi:MAG: S26 family signal peptidase [Pirellulales bacterium]|nr:S26 family signal peptidase [Pirellulales bacterium]